MSTPLAVDIETAGYEWSTLDSEVQEYLKTRGPEDTPEEEAKEKLGLSPGTGRIVAIGMWKPERDRGGVFLKSGNSPSGWLEKDWGAFGNESMVFKGSEEDILKAFWEYVADSSIGRLITYNGRSFDGPFLMLRSATYGIKPSRTFMGYRYDFSDHCDLGEVVSAFRARRMETLDFWCRQLNIESPKKGMDGSDVTKAYRQNKMEKIGKYCLRDAKATGELFEVLKPMIDVMNG